MSMTYWGIIGFGICLDDISEYINEEKVKEYVHKFLPDEVFDDDLLQSDVFFGDPYSNMAEFLCEFDEDNMLSWEDDGQGTAYFLYEPVYPWLKNNRIPKSQQEIENKMIDIINKVYDIPINILMSKFDYFSTYGCG